jgi:hypothetical protein
MPAYGMIQVYRTPRCVKIDTLQITAINFAPNGPKCSPKERKLMTYEEVIQKMKEAIAQYEEGAIEATECFNYIATVVVRKLNEQ